MNLLDLLLVLFAIGAVANGFRFGMLARAASWIGLGAGLLLSAWTVPLALRLLDVSGSLSRMLVALLAFVITLMLLAGLGDVIGLRVRSALALTPLRTPDRILGGVAGGLAVLVVTWLLIPIIAHVPGILAQQARQSAIVDFVRGAAPNPPNTVQTVRRLIDRSRFPEVFADLEPTPDTGPPPAQLPVSAQTVGRVEAATVNVEAQGCGRQFEGSGWAAGPTTVVTNAHVVAGADTVHVRRPDGAVLDATVVVFDDNRDVAVLQVSGLGQQPLTHGEPQDGAPGAAVGYPGGQNQPRTASARVDNVRTALGRDIYGEDLTRRQVVVVAARLAQGDSGGPVVDGGGAVVGTTFAISPDRSGTAFALAPDETRAALNADRRPGFTGRCM